MPKAILVVMTRPTDAAREDEFNDWYDNRHLGEVLEIPGIKAARRFKLADVQLDEPGSALGQGLSYLALYEIEVDDLETIGTELREREADGRIFQSDAVDGKPVPPAWLFTQI